MKLHLFASLILVIFLILPLNEIQYDVIAENTVYGNISEYVEHDDQQKRMENEKNFRDLLSMVKDVGKEAVSASSKYDVPEYPESDNNVFKTPQYWFSYEWWRRQDQNEKKALVTGYIAFLHILIKKEICLKEEEKSRYDHFCKLVTINDLVNHVDKLFENPLYRNEGAQILISRYMTYNFQNYIGDPLMMPA